MTTRRIVTDPDFYRWMRHSLRMAQAFRHDRRMRVVWQERAADYRECIIDYMRRRYGWTLSERLAGRRD